MENSRWIKIPLEEAKKHPLYGVSGWLLVLWSYWLCWPLHLWQHDLNMGFLGVLIVLFCTLPLYLSFKEKIRFLGVALFVVLPPLIVLFNAYIFPGARLFSIHVNPFAVWMFFCVFGVPYLLLSKRVRVTFENTVLRETLAPENAEAVIRANSYETPPTPASTGGIAPSVVPESATAPSVMRNARLQDFPSAAPESAMVPLEGTAGEFPSHWESALLAKKYPNAHKLFQGLLNHLEFWGKLNGEINETERILPKEGGLLLKEKLQSMKEEKQNHLIQIVKAVTNLKNTLHLDAPQLDSWDAKQQEIDYAMALYKEAYPARVIAHKSWELLSPQLFRNSEKPLERSSIDGNLPKTSSMRDNLFDEGDVKVWLVLLVIVGIAIVAAS
jgi:hypothetical protein